MRDADKIPDAAGTYLNLIHFGDTVLKRALLIGAMAESLIEFRADLIRDLVARGYKVTGAAAAPLTPEVLDQIHALGADFVPLPLQRTGINPP